MFFSEYFHIISEVGHNWKQSYIKYNNVLNNNSTATGVHYRSALYNFFVT